MSFIERHVMRIARIVFVGMVAAAVFHIACIFAG
jgi:hypothetical protein